jgi:thiol-disulfide isomerase/thioredoxin
MWMSLLALFALTSPQIGARATLVPGSKAPALAVGAWLKGAPVELGQGKVVVLDFWAPTNEQCRASQPHLSALARQHGVRVAVVGVTGPDERTTQESAQKYLDERGPALEYAVAWDATRRAFAAFVEAASQRMLPCSFVIDGKGVIAFIGNPMFVPEAVAGVLGGTWDSAKDPAALAADERELLTLYALGSSDPKASLAKLTTLEGRRPRLGALTEPLRFELALTAADWKLAEAAGARMLERASANSDADAARAIAWRLVDPERPLAQCDLTLALRAAEKAVALTGSRDWRALETLGRTCVVRKDSARAVEVLTQAITLAPPLAKTTLLELLQEVQERGE